MCWNLTTRGLHWDLAAPEHHNGPCCKLQAIGESIGASGEFGGRRRAHALGFVHLDSAPG